MLNKIKALLSSKANKPSRRSRQPLNREGAEGDFVLARLKDGIFIFFKGMGKWLKIFHSSTDLIPDKSRIYSLGSNIRRWKNLYLSNGALYIGDTKDLSVKLSADGSDLLFKDKAGVEVKVVGKGASEDADTSLEHSVAFGEDEVSNKQGQLFLGSGFDNEGGIIYGSLSPANYNSGNYLGIRMLGYATGGKGLSIVGTTSQGTSSVYLGVHDTSGGHLGFKGVATDPAAVNGIGIIYVDSDSGEFYYRNNSFSPLKLESAQAAGTRVNLSLQDITTDLIPNADEGVNLGKASSKFHTLYCEAVRADSGSIYIGDIKMSVTGVGPAAKLEVEAATAEGGSSYSADNMTITPQVIQSAGALRLEAATNITIRPDYNGNSLAKVLFQRTTDGGTTYRDALTIDEKGNVQPGNMYGCSLGSKSKKFKQIWAKDGHFDKGSIFLGDLKLEAAGEGNNAKLKITNKAVNDASSYTTGNTVIEADFFQNTDTSDGSAGSVVVRSQASIAFRPDYNGNSKDMVRFQYTNDGGATYQDGIKIYEKGHIIPGKDGFVNLGSKFRKFKSIYAGDGYFNKGTVYIGDLKITQTGDGTGAKLKLEKPQADGTYGVADATVEASIFQNSDTASSLIIQAETNIAIRPDYNGNSTNYIYIQKADGGGGYTNSLAISEDADFNFSNTVEFANAGTKIFDISPDGLSMNSSKSIKVQNITCAENTMLIKCDENFAVRIDDNDTGGASATYKIQKNSTGTDIFTIDENANITDVNNLTLLSDLLLSGGGNIGTGGGGGTAIAVSSAGEVTAIGQDTPADDEVLTWDDTNSKVVWSQQPALATSTRIKILPSDFKSVGYQLNHSVARQTDYADVTTMHATGGYSYDQEQTTDAVACVIIPSGFRATHANVYSNDTSDQYRIYEGNIANSVTTAKSSATNCDTEVNMTDVVASTTNYLAIVFYPNANAAQIHGGYITIERV